MYRFGKVLRLRPGADQSLIFDRPFGFWYRAGSLFDTLDSHAQHRLMDHPKAWFEEWFDTPYYHILYKDRNQKEAANFIDNLIQTLNMRKGQKILDLACGKGRHSIYLNKKGFDVVGADLSASNIEHASTFQNETLRFKVHDMRKSILPEHYDFILNMFTSFGYFESEEENLDTLRSVFVGLKSGGEFLIDFLNCEKIINHLDDKEFKEIGNIKFEISKTFVEGYIIKNILIEADGDVVSFQEKVMAISLEKFRRYFEEIGFEEIAIYGDYSLGNFAEQESERLILRVRKP